MAFFSFALHPLVVFPWKNDVTTVWFPWNTRRLFVWVREGVGTKWFPWTKCFATNWGLAEWWWMVLLLVLTSVHAWPHMSQMKCLIRAQNWMWHWSTKNQMWCFVSKQKISSVAKPAQIAMPVLFGFFIVEAAINGWKTMSLHKSAARKKLSLVWVCQPHKWSNWKRMHVFSGGDKIRLPWKTPLPCLQTISLPWFSNKGHHQCSER